MTAEVAYVGKLVHGRFVLDRLAVNPSYKIIYDTNGGRSVMLSNREAVDRDPMNELAAHVRAMMRVVR